MKPTTYTPRTDYIVINATTESEFARLVRQYLDRGWNLQGGISLACDAHGGRWFAQALTKEVMVAS